MWETKITASIRINHRGDSNEVLLWIVKRNDKEIITVTNHVLILSEPLLCCAYVNVSKLKYWQTYFYLLCLDCHYCQNTVTVRYTLMCLSIGTPKNNKFSICFKWKIYYF